MSKFENFLIFYKIFLIFPISPVSWGRQVLGGGQLFPSASPKRRAYRRAFESRSLLPSRKKCCLDNDSLGNSWIFGRMFQKPLRIAWPVGLLGESFDSLEVPQYIR